MTDIIYDREELCLSMEGHALSAEYGADIICAAESMLIMCLEKRMEELGESVMLTVKKSPGSIYLRADPTEEAEELCRESFDTIFSGLALLAEYEPEHVRARMRDTEESEGHD